MNQGDSRGSLILEWEGFDLKFEVNWSRLWREVLKVPQSQSSDQDGGGVGQVALVDVCVVR